MKTKPYYILRPFPENKVEAIHCNDSMKETKKCLPHFLSQSSWHLGIVISNHRVGCTVDMQLPYWVSKNNPHSRVHQLAHI